MHCKFAATVDYTKNAETVDTDLTKKFRTKTDIDGSSSTMNVDQVNVDLGNNKSLQPLSSEKVMAPRNDDEIDLDMKNEKSINSPLPPATNVSSQALVSTHIFEEDFVLESFRTQLPASFFKPVPRFSDADISIPSSITNIITRFLALDKCLSNRNFLEILSIDPISQIEISTDLSFKLSYDKEWLAITRVFADELKLSDMASQIPTNKDESHYIPLITVEKKWVEENIITIL